MLRRLAKFTSQSLLAQLIKCIFTMLQSCFIQIYFLIHYLVKCNLLKKKIKKNKFIENGPRRIDLDLIQFENLKIKNHVITIPHTSAHLRDFVLKPILDLNPQFIDLNTKKTYKKLLSNLNERFIIKQSRQTQDYRGFF